MTLIAPACKKDKEDPQPPSTENNTNDPASNGSMSADANGTAFEAENIEAQLNFSNKLTIMAFSENALIYFSISSFAGAISYSLSPQWNNTADYSTQFAFSTDYGGSGNLTITAYNETDMTISGHFQFVAGMSGTPANTITISEGSFENVSVNNISGPEEGHALYTINGNLGTPDTARVHITDHYRFVVDIDQNTSRYRFHAYTSPNVNPLNINSGKLLQQSIATGNYFNVLDNPDVEITEYNEDELYVSGRIYSSSDNLDIRFNRIPLTPPTTVPSGGAVLTDPNGSITFEDADYTIIGGYPTIYRMEATNGNNQKIIAETAYDPYVYEPSHFYGYTGTLTFYEDADGPATYSKSGYFKDYSGNPGDNVGFVSFQGDGAYSVKGYQVE